MKISAFFNQNIYNWRTGNGDEIFPDPRYIIFPDPRYITERNGPNIVEMSVLI